jgi:hypothetical protein
VVDSRFYALDTEKSVISEDAFVMFFARWNILY